MATEKPIICRIEIEALLRLKGAVTFDIYIRLSEDKTIKLSHGEDIHLVLPRYKEKGVEYVYVIKDHYIQYLESLRKNMANKFYDPKTTTDEQAMLLDDSYKAARESFGKLGLTENAVLMAEDVSKKGWDVVNKSNNIYQFFLAFKAKCDEQLMKKMLVSYTVTLMISTFDWQSSSIKEKASLSCILSDINLEPADFALMDACGNNYDKLPPKIFNHPLEISKILQEGGSTLVSKETIIMIEQHHEKPDGSGYPKKIRHSTITLLSAIQIVAEDFVDLLVRNNFNHKLHKEMLASFFQKYYQGNFRKATISLYKMFGVEVPGFKTFDS